MIDYRRLILSLDNKPLESFVRDWVALDDDKYHEVRRYGGTGDLGRDVVGFLTKRRHEGAWHNHQCKQLLRRALPFSEGLIEIAKTFYHADAEGFTLPERYAFVAPHGVSTRLGHLIDKPSDFRTTLVDSWDSICARKLVENQNVPLAAGLRAKIESYDFGNVWRVDVEDILAHPKVSLVLHKHFGADPGPAPVTKAPIGIDPREIRYLTQLVDAYSERSNWTIASPEAALIDPTHGVHLRKQRERFYDAEFFMHYYRDSTAPEVLPTLESDIENGIFETHNAQYSYTLDRIDAVMKQAATVDPSGPLKPHTRVPVRQGICHRFANDGRLAWKK